MDVALLGIPLLLNVLANAAAPSGSPFGDPRRQGASQDPENEIEDFPVMWAASGTIARTLPWQLDPSRQPKGFRTELALTERRILVIGVDESAGSRSEHELWDAPRGSVEVAERLRFSEGSSDVRIRFTDGSWTRWKTDNASRLVGHLTGQRKTATETDLTPEQRAGVAELLTNPPFQASPLVGKALSVETPPELELLTSHVVAVHIRIPISNGTEHRLTRHLDEAGIQTIPDDEVL